MKLKFILSVFTFYLFLVLNAQDKIIINPNAPEITFEKEIIDMGTYNQYDDESSRCEFKFTNTGKEPLIIEKAKGSCGCTVAEWPRELVAPGDNAIIKVTFNSEKKEGKQNKTVALVTNAIPSTKVLTIKGTVLVSKNN